MNIDTTKLLCAILALFAWRANAQSVAARVELLWPGGAPGALGTEEVDRPTLGIYLPAADKASKSAEEASKSLGGERQGGHVLLVQRGETAIFVLVQPGPAPAQK